jgi:hypothetical protein
LHNHVNSLSFCYSHNTVNNGSVFGLLFSYIYRLINLFAHMCAFVGSRVSSGSILSDYGLDDRAIGVRSPAGAKDFSSVLCVQTGSGAHPTSCTMGTGGPFPGGKAWPGRDADHHLVPRSRAIPPLPTSASMACSGTTLLYFIPKIET